MDVFASLVDALSARGVRFVVIGVWGANYYAPSGGALFSTLDRDLFLPPDAGNLRSARHTCESQGLSLLAGPEPLDPPRDIALAQSIVERRALTRASDGRGTDVDLSLVMSGFDFDSVWAARNVFEVDGVQIPVARLEDIVASKAAAGREKDRLFLAAHRDALAELLPDGEESC